MFAVHICAGFKVFKKNIYISEAKKNKKLFYVYSITYLSQLDAKTPLFYSTCIKDLCVSICTGFTLRLFGKRLGKIAEGAVVGVY
jgi:hypothetical protein